MNEKNKDTNDTGNQPLGVFVLWAALIYYSDEIYYCRIFMITLSAIGLIGCFGQQSKSDKQIPQTPEQALLLNSYQKDTDKSPFGMLAWFVLCAALAYYIDEIYYYKIFMITLFAFGLVGCFGLQSKPDKQIPQSPIPTPQTVEQALILNSEQLTRSNIEAPTNEILSEVTLHLEIQPSTETTQTTLDQQMGNNLANRIDSQDVKLQQNEMETNKLKEENKNLKRQVNKMQNDINELKNKTTVHDEKIVNLKNKTDELEWAHQNIQQEIRNSGSIPPKTRQKMQESPPKLILNRYITTSPIRENSNLEPKATSNNSAAI